MTIEAQLPDWRLVQEEGRLGDCDASHADPSLALDPREPGAAGMVLFGLVRWIASVWLPGSIPGDFPGRHTVGSVSAAQPRRMTHLHDLRLRLLVQQESERIAESQPDDLDLSVVQARTLCWLALLTEAHEEQACDAERRGDVEQAMGWFADAMRLRDVIQVVTSIEIPLPAHSDGGGRDAPLDDLQDWGGSFAV